VRIGGPPEIVVCGESGGGGNRTRVPGPARFLAFDSLGHLGPWLAPKLGTSAAAYLISSSPWLAQHVINGRGRSQGLLAAQVVDSRRAPTSADPRPDRADPPEHVGRFSDG